MNFIKFNQCRMYSSSRRSEGRYFKWVGFISVFLGSVSATIYYYFYYPWRHYPSEARSLMKSGLVASNKRDYDHAEWFMKHAIELTEASGGNQNQNPKLLAAYLRIPLAQLYAQQSKFEESMVQYSQAFHILKENEMLQKTVELVQEFSGVIEESNYPGAAVHLLLWAIQTAKELKLDEKTQIAPLYQTVAQCLHSQRMEDDAIFYYKKALHFALMDKKTQCEACLILNNLSSISLEKEERENFAKQGLAISKKSCPELIPLSLYNLARIQESQKEAQKLLLQALELELDIDLKTKIDDILESYNLVLLE